MYQEFTVGFGEEFIYRQDSICAHTMLENKLLEIPDLNKDARFQNHKRNWRFYAGYPLISSKGNVLGTFFVADKVKRKLSSEQKESLSALAQQVVYLIEYQAARHQKTS